VVNVFVCHGNETVNCVFSTIVAMLRYCKTELLFFNLLGSTCNEYDRY